LAVAQLAAAELEAVELEAAEIAVFQNLETWHVDENAPYCLHSLGRARVVNVTVDTHGGSQEGIRNIV
jgi:hypothetical protein